MSSGESLAPVSKEELVPIETTSGPITHTPPRAMSSIIRAAVVQELRHMAAELEETDRRLMLDCPCWNAASDLLWARADELETQGG